MGMGLANFLYFLDFLKPLALNPFFLYTIIYMINKNEELTWILSMLQSDLKGTRWGAGGSVVGEDSDIYLLEHIIRYKDYSRKDVESWAKEHAGLINKIDDVLHVRLLAAAQAGKVGKGIAVKRLSAKYDYKEKVEHSGDLVINIMKEGAGL